MATIKQHIDYRRELVMSARHKRFHFIWDNAKQVVLNSKSLPVNGINLEEQDEFAIDELMHKCIEPRWYASYDTSKGFDNAKADFLQYVRYMQKREQAKPDGTD